MEPWKTLERHTILEFDKFLTVESHRVQLPDGRIIERWPWVITPDYVIVLAQTVAGAFLCFRQTKYGIDGVTLAPVGGYMQPGEDALLAAKRELLEETGYQASEWIGLGHYRVDANRGNGVGNLFLARGAHHVAEIRSDDLEVQELLHLSRSELESALAAGEFKALPWAATVAFALRHLED